MIIIQICYFVSYAVEYDFSADGDVEIVAVNENKGTSFLFVFSYSKGIIQELLIKCPIACGEWMGIEQKFSI